MKIEVLCELWVCDRVQSALSDNCLKYVLSIESVSDKGWIPLKDLTKSVDMIASKGDSAKPRAFAVGQSPTNLFGKIRNRMWLLASAYIPRFGKKLAKPVSISETATP